MWIVIAESTYFLDASEPTVDEERIMARPLCGQFDDIAVRITEIDRIDEAMIGDAAGLDAGCLALCEHGLQHVMRDFERDMQIVVVLHFELECCHFLFPNQY